MRRTKEQQGSRGAGEQRSLLLRYMPARWLLYSSLPFLCLLVWFLLSLAFPLPADAGTDALRILGLQAPNEALEAPTFALSDLTGKKIQLKDFRGKLVFLNFFATWCGPCREEMPGMERLSHTYRDKGLVVLAVNFKESAKAFRPFVQELKLSFPTVLDGAGSVTYEYGVRALPVSFLIGRDGNVLWRAIGGREWDTKEMQDHFAQIVVEKK
jgi:thiol-disulfide isomerase/thioredoxin